MPLIAARTSGSQFGMCYSLVLCLLGHEEDLCVAQAHRVPDASPSPTWMQFFWPGSYTLNDRKSSTC